MSSSALDTELYCAGLASNALVEGEAVPSAATMVNGCSQPFTFIKDRQGMPQKGGSFWNPWGQEIPYGSNEQC